MNIKEKFSKNLMNNEKIYYSILIFTTILAFIFKFSVSLETNSLWADIVKIFFNYIILFGAIFTTVRNLNWKNNDLLKEEMVFSFLVNNITFMFAPLTKINVILNHGLYLIFPFDIFKAILDDGTAILWALPWIFVQSVLNMYLNTYKNKNNSNKLARKMINNGVFIYTILTIAVWIFAHFTYISTNLYYISQKTRMVDSLVENGIKNNKQLLKTLKVYDDNQFTEFKNDIDKELKEKNAKKSEIDELNRWLKIVEKPTLINQKRNFEQIEDFWQWISFVFNSGDIKVTADKIIMTALIFPVKEDLKNTSIKHGFLYIKSYNGKKYVYFNIDSTFKDTHQNIIFNEFYALFHYVYWICFLILFKYHKKRIFKKEVANVQ